MVDKDKIRERLDEGDLDKDKLEELNGHTTYDYGAGVICIDCGMEHDKAGPSLLDSRPCAGDDYLLG